jgi:hypothetical protein
LISSSSRDCFMMMYLILSTLFISWHGHGLVRLYTSAVHFHSFRFAGGSLHAFGFRRFPPSHFPHYIILLKHFPLYYMWTFLLSLHTFFNSYTLFMIYHFTLSYDKIDSISFLYHIYHPRVFNVIRWVLMRL